MAVQVASLFGVLSLRDQGFRSGMQSARGELQQLGSATKRGIAGLQSFTSNMALLTAPIGLAFGAAAKSAHTFDRAMSNVNAILGITGDEAANLRSEILKYGGNTVAGPQKTAEAFFDIVSGVADATTHMAILEAATRTSEAGQADLQATTNAVIATMNSYKLKTEDATFVSDVFTRTVGKGVLTMDELASALPLATGLAAQFNVPLEKVAGSLAFMTTQGFKAAQSATFLKSMITTLLNPTADLEGAITGLGFASGQALLESEGLIGAYQLLSEQGDGLAGLITNQEALTGSLLLTQDAAKGFMTDYLGGIDGATAKAGAIQGQTDTWERLRSKMQEVGIQLGTILTPIVDDFIDNQALPVLDAVSDWADANPGLALTLVKVAAGAFIGTVAIGLLGGVIGAATGAIVGLLTFALSPLGLALLIGGVLVGAYVSNWQGFRDFIDKQVRPIVMQLLSWLQEINAQIQTFMGGIRELAGIDERNAAAKIYQGMLPTTGVPQIDAILRFSNVQAGLAQFRNPPAGTAAQGQAALQGRMIGLAGNPITQPGTLFTGGLSPRPRITANEATLNAASRTAPERLNIPELALRSLPGMGGVNQWTIQNLTVQANDPDQLSQQLQDVARRRGS